MATTEKPLGLRLQDRIFELAQEFWHAELASVPWGSPISVTSRENRVGELHSDLVNYEYADTTHLYCRTQNGVRIGLPTCFIVDVEVIND